MVNNPSAGFAGMPPELLRTSPQGAFLFLPPPVQGEVARRRRDGGVVKINNPPVSCADIPLCTRGDFFFSSLPCVGVALQLLGWCRFSGGGVVRPLYYSIKTLFYGSTVPISTIVYLLNSGILQDKTA